MQRSRDEFSSESVYEWIKMILEDKEEPLWFKLVHRTFMNILTHPFDYAKVLIQIGHEPIEPTLTTTLLTRKPALKLPNVFTYVKYIKSVDGFTGCFRGLMPKLCAQTIFAIAYDKTIYSIKFEGEIRDSNILIDDLELNQRQTKYFQNYIKVLVARSIGIIVSHPFDVISVRMMAQFVGGETKYVTIVGSILEIFRENGISGFFAGIVPRLIASAATLAIVNSSTYALNQFFIKDRETRCFTSATMSFLASTITYPLLVVSQCMAINHCGLAAGEPPMMPIYVDWIDCWVHLSKINQLKRGSSLLWRYYTGPQILINGRPFIDKNSLSIKKID